MCGIAGAVDRTGAPIDDSVIGAMTRILAHRGPDGEGVWTDHNVGFGHRRLAIRDLTDAGRQPIADPSGRIVVTFNGEIYNDVELRRELARDFGATFHSTCDAETLPIGYLAWGDRLFDRLEGMFAIALWDRSEQRLVLARDAAGIKPLYVFANDRLVAFGSEVKALLEVPGVPRVIDPEALHAYMAQGYVSPDRGLIRGVGQVPPGTVRTIDARGVHDRTFWRAARHPDIRDPREAVEGFLDRWRVVVKDMLVSDVPLGVLQSGGLDSSLITAQLAQLGLRVPVFTGGYGKRRTHDESDVAQAVAAATGMPHHIVPIGEEADPQSIFRTVVHHFDGQLADSSGYSVYQLTREVRRYVPVVLGGDGADEYFGGYPTYRATRIGMGINRVVPPSMLSAAGSVLHGLTRSDERRLPALEVLARLCFGLGTSPGVPHPEWRRLLYAPFIDELYGPALKPFRGVDPLREYSAAIERAEGSVLDRCLLADQTHYLPADMLMKVDAMSMAHGLEVRVPFLDRRIMEFAGRLDGSLLSPLRGPDKLVLRRALDRLLPKGTVPAGKRGFNTPVASMLRSTLSPLGDRAFIQDVDRLAPFFDARGVTKVWLDHRERRANHGYTLWSLLTFSTWLESLEMASTSRLQAVAVH
jgi:asparagine synthase (glutamine-hydrolysing)